MSAAVSKKKSWRFYTQEDSRTIDKSNFMRTLNNNTSMTEQFPSSINETNLNSQNSLSQIRKTSPIVIPKHAVTKAVEKSKIINTKFSKDRKYGRKLHEIIVNPAQINFD